MHYAKLGKNGPVVSRVAVGSDVNVPPDTFLGILRKGGELGINFIDTDITYVYQDPEKGDVRMWNTIRTWLQETNRSDVVLVSKTLEKTAEGARKEITEALEGMDTDYLDVFMIHAVDTPELWNDMQPALEEIMRAREEGLVRQVGMSIHTVTMAGEAAKHPELEVLLVSLNYTGKAMKRSGTRQQMEDAMRVLYEQGRGVYIMKSLAHGRVFQEEEDAPDTAGVALEPAQVEKALDYVFRFPYAHAVAIGMKSVEEMEEDVSIAERVDSERGTWPTTRDPDS